MDTIRQGYIEMRNSQKLNNSWLWRYYQSEGGKVKNPNEFLEKFYFEEVPIIFNGEVIGSQRTQRDFSDFFSNMDRKFGITTLWDKENNFIKVC